MTSDDLCLSCPLPICVYEDEAPRDAICPKSVNQKNPKYNSHLRMTPWREGILSQIQEIITERGRPVPLIEFIALGVDRSTLHAWRSKYLKTTKIKIPYNKWKSYELVHIVEVKFE